MAGFFKFMMHSLSAPKNDHYLYFFKVDRVTKREKKTSSLFYLREKIKLMAGLHKFIMESFISTQKVHAAIDHYFYLNGMVWNNIWLARMLT